MARLVRTCTQCGSIDDRRSWSSTDEVANNGAFAESWTCSTCAWTEFDLVEAPEPSATERTGPIDQFSDRADDRPGAERARVAARSRGAVDPTFRSPV